MRKGSESDKNLVVDILSKSFLDNKSTNYVVKQDHKREDRIRRLVEYSFYQCIYFGEVLISDNNKGCALIMIPSQKRFSIRAIFWDIKLALSAIGLTRVLKVMKREKIVKTHHPNDKVCYLWFIGVDPLYQNEGTGSKLLMEILDKYDKRGMPIYLETSVDRNLPWYKRFGFEIFNSIEFTYTLFMLRRTVIKNMI
ncbi:MAG TPA: GNAT family N-acetyltransferase [Cyclobacteriaceae bacterium]|nr:GNAT family N-acetyltransferase [Cyclobacteriaceae bacterium]